ncbi:MAG: Ig-like domain-containing protein [Ectothiorhodospiraceae bacterium]|nr:Ig-like domain-containing protein [Ectothiorhodospiraceae bacterium]
MDCLPSAGVVVSATGRCSGVRPAAALFFLVALLLQGCIEQSGDPSSQTRAESRSPIGPAGLGFVYPPDGQMGVPAGAPLLLYWEAPPEGDALEALMLEDAQGAQIPLAIRRPAGAPDVLHLHPPRLEAGSAYTLRWDGEPLSRFETAVTAPSADTAPELRRMLPDGERLPVLPDSTLRLRFSEPLDAASVRLHDSVHVRDADGDAVPGHLKVQGSRVVFAAAEPLEAGAAYTLEGTAAVRGENGRQAVAAHRQFRPLDPGEVASQHYRLVGDRSAVSRVTGLPINAKALDAALLGSNMLAMSGGLNVRVADPRAFSRLIPFTVPAGQALQVEPLDMRLASTVPGGLHTDTLTVVFLTNGNGYFFDNPFTDDGRRDGVAAVLDGDLAIIAREPNAHGVFTQQFLDVRSAGLLHSREGRLVLELVGMLDAAVLGGASGGLAAFSLRLEGPDDVIDEGVPAPLELLASAPADGSDFIDPRHQIQLLFSEPPDARSIVPEQNLLLLRNGTDSVAFSVRPDGAALMLAPEEPLQRGADYVVDVAGDIRSVRGGYLQNPGQRAFHVPALDAPDGAPQLLGINVGVPCALVGGNATSGGDIAGRCRGGRSSDVLLEVFEQPADRAVEVYFDRPVDLESMVPAGACGAGTVRLERVDGNGQCSGPVATVMDRDERSVRLRPVRPLSVGERYQLVIESAGIIGAGSGLPLNTAPLTGGSGGGHTVVMPFLAVAPTDGIYTSLKSNPYTDVDGNGVIGPDERPRAENSIAMDVAGVSGNVTDASITGEHRSFISYSLMVDILTAEAADGRIPVRVSPQVLLGTGIELAVNYRALGIINFNAVAETGRLLIRQREASIGYIVEGPDGGPWFELETELYIDAPDMTVSGAPGVQGNQLMRSMAAPIRLEGPISYTDDGRLQLNLENVEPMQLHVVVDPSIPLSGSGALDIRMPPGAVKLQMRGPPLRGDARLQGMFR